MNRYFNQGWDWAFDMLSLSDIYMALECDEQQIYGLGFQPVQCKQIFV